MMALVYTASDVPDGNVHQTKRDHYREPGTSRSWPPAIYSAWH